MTSETTFDSSKLCPGESITNSSSTSLPSKVTRKLLFKGKDARESEICCSVEEVETDAKEEGEDENDENYEESAKNIKVVETEFRRPLRSSFRAKKGERRISAVLFDADPVVLLSPPGNTDTDAEVNNLQSSITNGDSNGGQEKHSSNEVDIDNLTEAEFVKLNFGLRSRIRRDSLDKTPSKSCDDAER